MSAVFRWAERVSPPAQKVGDRRTVSRFLLWPKKLDGEWRWLGFERITQEFQRYWVLPVDMEAMQVVGWRDKQWATLDIGIREGRVLSNVKAPGRNGPPAFPRTPPPPPPPRKARRDARR